MKFMNKQSKKTKRKKQFVRVKENMVDSPSPYFLYTDGSGNNLSNFGDGGYAYVLIKDGKIIKQFSEGKSKVTSNQMELKAIIEGCKAVPEDNSTVIIRSDSMYALKVLSGRWKAKVNLDLIAEHQKNVQRLDLCYDWVKSHNGDKFNELCDKLAKEATHQIKQINEADNKRANHSRGVPSFKKGETSRKSAQSYDYHVYATSIFEFGYICNAYIVYDKEMNSIAQDAFFSKNGSIYAGVLQAIINGCATIDECNVNIEVVSNVEYGVKILGGYWKPKKNFDLIQKQFDYEHNSKSTVKYRNSKPNELYMREAILLANRKMSDVVSTFASRVLKDDETDDPENIVDYEPDHYRLMFSAKFGDGNKAICCYALSRESDSRLNVEVFEQDFKLEQENTEESVLSLVLVILAHAFKNIPGDAKISIYSKECYSFLSYVFCGDAERSFAIDAYQTSLVKFTDGGELRDVEIIDGRNSRLYHALERKIGIEA